MRFFVIALFLFLTILPGFYQTGAEGTERKTISTIMEKARKDGAEMTLPDNRHAEKGLRAAKKAANTFNSPDFQEQIQCEQERLEKEVFGDYIAAWKKKEKSSDGQSSQTDGLADTEQVYLFVSSSMPDETVHAYLSAIADAGEPKVIPVMRGFVGGMADIQAGTEYFRRILKKDLRCQNAREPCQRYQLEIKLKSPLFAQYGITRVPSVVYESQGQVFLIQGDAGFDYLLELINREVKSSALDNLINKIRNPRH
ncbi:MAG: type-F conjugative transfer system pilin assembly protein TrbC [Desulfobulbaceae bacterium]|nr:type-F conjugative transfer system pilin assembly protein TrbC [Desulfobulbaceae bacterium]